MWKTRLQQILCLISLLVPAIATWWTAISFDFINWDDPSYILSNSLIRGWSLENLSGICTETVTRNYAPITIFSYLVDHTIWGLQPAGYHLSNIIGHCICGMLVYVLVSRLTGSAFVAWTTAMLFLVHPVQVETVAWVSSRKGILSGIFMLWALVVRLRSDLQPKHDAWYIGLLIAALLSKALAVVLPPIVFLYDVLIRRDRISDAIVRQFIPGLISLLLLLHTTGAQNTVMGGVRGHMNLSLAEIVAVDITILWQYIGMMIWPADLCVLYDPPTAGIALPVIVGSIGWLIVGAVIWRYRREAPLLLWAAATWLLLLFPVLNFFRITTLMNDRYLYLPCIVFFGVVAALVEHVASLLMRRWKAELRTAVLMFCSLIISLAACRRTTEYLPVFGESERLWTYAMERCPQLVVVRIQMALTLYDRGRTEEAIEVMETALRECETDELDRRRMVRTLERWGVSSSQQHASSGGTKS
ncbi:MAG: hypothetical protein JNL58_13080 [Planctomyces sp.]|nr:hypothetical protein [Planctomyces sp.]